MLIDGECDGGREEEEELELGKVEGSFARKDLLLDEGKGSCRMVEVLVEVVVVEMGFEGKEVLGIDGPTSGGERRRSVEERAGTYREGTNDEMSTCSGSCRYLRR